MKRFVFPPLEGFLIVFLFIRVLFTDLSPRYQAMCKQEGLIVHHVYAYCLMLWAQVLTWGSFPLVKEISFVRDTYTKL